MRLTLTFLICIFLCVILGLAQDTQSPVTLATWTTSIPAFRTDGDGKAITHSIFTPGLTIVITRIEAYSQQGPLQMHSYPQGPTVCSPQPSLQLLGAGVKYDLRLSSTFLPDSLATYTDSGPVNLSVAAGTRLNLLIVNPENRQQVPCDSREIKVVVQYRAETTNNSNSKK